MKDSKGHGSDTRGGTGTQGMRLVKTHVAGPHFAKVYKNPEWGENVVKFFHNGAYQPKADYFTNDMSDAHATAQSALNRYTDQDAKAALASGPKSAPVPVHDSMMSDAEQGRLSGRQFVDRGDSRALPDGSFKADWPSSPRYKATTRLNAWGQTPETAKAVRKQIRDNRRQSKMRSYP